MGQEEKKEEILTDLMLPTMDLDILALSALALSSSIETSPPMPPVLVDL